MAYSAKSNKSLPVDSGGGGSEEDTVSTASTPTPPAPDEIEKIYPNSTDGSSQMKVITPLQSVGGGSHPSSSVSLGGSVLRVNPWAQELENAWGEEGRGGGGVGRNSEREGCVASSTQAVPSFQKSSFSKQSGGYQFYPLNSTSPSQSQSSSAGIMSSVTTASEIDFRNNLATLDSDIARLQMQFKVALQSPK